MTESFLKNDFEKIIKESKKYLVGGELEKDIDKKLIDGNFQSWRLIQNLISDRFILSKSMGDNIMQNDIAAGEKVSMSRVGNWVDERNKYETGQKYNRALVNYYKFIRVAEYLESIRDKGNKHISGRVAAWKRDGSYGPLILNDCFSAHKDIRVYQVSNVIIVKVNKLREGKDTYFMTNVHFSRVVDYLKSAAILSLFSPDIHGLGSNISTLLKLFRLQAKIGLKTPNGVGSVFKCARQILFLRGDTSRSLGRAPVDMYIAGLSGVKEKYGEKVADYITDITDDRKSAINLANIFRMVPHPDQNMGVAFETIDGFKQCNPVDLNKMDRFEGIARKSVYESLSAQKLVIRAEAKDPDNEIAKSFVNSINSTSTPTSSLLSAGYTKWAAVKFLVVRGAFDEDRQDIPVSNKASAQNSRLSKEDIESIGTNITISSYRALKDRLTSVNDIVSRIKGRDELNFKEGRKRFKMVIKAHEEFEEKYIKAGKTIDDIPSDDLSEFITSDPDHSYTVNTEPKLGEVHKEITRMFYMAEQALKIMTQVAERFTKKIISKSSGISIVKDYRSRRKELEEMLNSYTGIVIGESDSVLYISFDMSEFSKKFSQKIVRKIGEILSELSGEDWMARIDLFFRASVVYHNTRGFMGTKSGVTGGFEGFLNFLWTLAMKVVMDIATQATGVTGVLAVYSDDGLLRLYIDGTAEEVGLKVKTIQKVFKAYGLIFHMDKTVASNEIMEYLGVYGEKGTIIPTWIKESMSIGKRKKGKGLETVYDKMTLWDSQCNAVVKAGGPTYPSFLLKTILSIRTLRKFHTVVPSNVLAVLTAIPYSCGGFRVSSISESAILSSISGFMEFCADMELMYEDYPTYVTAIIERITDNLRTPKDAEKAIITSSLLQTEITDTSGSGIARSLLDGITVDGIMTTDPLTPAVVKSILQDLRNCVNIPIEVLKRLIQTIPDVIEYNQSIAIMKSDAALKFVDSKKIRRAQSSDTRIVKDSIERWRDILVNYSIVGRRFVSTDLANFILRQVYPEYDIANMADSPRTAIKLTDTHGDIITSIEFTENNKLLYQSYKEPAAKFLGAQLSAEYTAEFSASTEQRRNDRFIAVAARIVATNQSLLPLYYIIANTFNLPSPVPPSITVTSAHRSTRNFGFSAVNVFIPAPYHALINSRMSNNMWAKLEGFDRVDRTTMIEASRIATYLNSSPYDNTSGKVKAGVRSYNYIIRNLVNVTSNPVFRSLARPKPVLMNKSVTKTFTDTMVEENAQANALESSINTNNLLETIKDTPIVKAIILSNFEKWLQSSISGTYTMNKLPPDIPNPWKIDIYAESCISVSFKLSSPNVRRAIQSSLSIVITKSFHMEIGAVMSDAAAMRDLEIGFSSKEWAFDELAKGLIRVGGAMIPIEDDNRIKELLRDFELKSPIFIKALIKYLKRKSVTGGANIPTVIINTESFADTKLSRNVKNAYKNAIDITLSKVLDDSTRAVNWRDIDKIDANINFLYILKNMIRPSGHRNTPFNKHMFAIQLIKFELFAAELITDGVTSVTTDVLKSYRTPEVISNAIIYQNAVIRGVTTRTTGEDMRKCLKDEGILTSCIARMNYIIGRLRDTYRSEIVSFRIIMNNNRFMSSFINYILETYTSIVGNTVSNIVIRHRRESEAISKATLITPVEEACMLAINSTNDIFVGYEEDFDMYFRNDDSRRLIINLINAHYVRWKAPGYNSAHYINYELKKFGIFGDCELSIRDIGGSPFNEEKTTADYTLSVTSYPDADAAINNYVFVNRISGGMAILANDGLLCLLFCVLPKDTRMINTLSLSLPDYLDDESRAIPIYSIPTVAEKIEAISRELSIRPQTLSAVPDVGSLLVRQTYQRILGSSTEIEDSDYFLVAISEVVRGSWSVDLGFRVLAMFTAWLTTNDRVRKADFRKIIRRMNDINSSDNGGERILLLNSVSTVWAWFKHRSIQAGPNLDTSKVYKIIEEIGRHIIPGGNPSVYYNLPPRTIREVKALKTILTVDDCLLGISVHIYIPPPISEEIIRYVESDDESDSDDSW